jgi:mannosyltransferase
MSIDAQRSDNRTLLQKAGKVPWFLLVILALATFLRIFGLGSSLWLDEVASVRTSETSLVSIIHTTTSVDTHPPLYYFLLHFWMLLFGQSEVAVQSLSALFGIISVLLMYMVARELFEPKTGLIAAFLLAISGFAIFYSQEVRMYSLLLSLTLLSFLFFVRILRANKPGRTHLICYSLADILLIYTHIYGLFTVGSQVLYFFLFRRRYAKAGTVFWGAQVATLVSFSPWIFVLLTSTLRGVAISGLAWLPTPSLGDIMNTLSSYVGAGLLWPLLVLTFLFLCLSGVVYIPRTRPRRGLAKPLQSTKQTSPGILIAEPKTALLLVWFFFPLVMSLFLSFTVRPIFWGKYLIGITPALYLLAARGIDNINSFVNTYVIRVNVTYVLVTYILLALIVLFSLPGLYDYYAYPQREQWREVANLVQSTSQPGDVVVLCPGGYRSAFDYYYEGDLERLGISEKVTQNEELTTFVDSAASGKERLWLVLVTYASTKDAPIKPYLFSRYGSDSLILQKEFVNIIVYLFDI